jgi:hypothetical protein
MPKLRVLRDLFGSTRDPLPTERDLRLDFFRGLALFAIFIDHIPENFLAWFTLQAVMSGDATEVFVFTSGFTGGMVYSRTMDRNGFLIAGIRVFHRVWQIYVAHILMFITLMATLAYTSDVLKTSRYIEYYIGTEAFLKEPGLALMRVLSLQYQPSFFMDVLPLYMPDLHDLQQVLEALLVGQDPRRLTARAAQMSREGSRATSAPASFTNVSCVAMASRAARRRRCQSIASVLRMSAETVR